jgi:hypothetical protein
MGLGPIPWSAIVSYAKWYDLDWDIADAFVDIIREMDDAYLKYQSDEQDRTKLLNKASSKGRKKT